MTKAKADLEEVGDRLVAQSPAGRELLGGDEAPASDELERRAFAAGLAIRRGKIVVQAYRYDPSSKIGGPVMSFRRFSRAGGAQGSQAKSCSPDRR
jgi:hypothetical protein